MPKRVRLPDSLNHFTVAEGRAAGLGAKRMMGADLERPFHGVRSTSRIADARTAAEAVEVACAMYLPLLAPSQFFSHTTAAVLWGCPLPARAQVVLPLHVSTRAPTRAPERANVVGHRVQRAGTGTRHGFPVADPVTTFCQLAPLLPLDDLVAIADHLVLDPAVLDPYDLRPYVSLPQLRTGVEAFTGRGCRAAASAILLTRVGAESRPETLLRLLLERAGFPEPELNCTLYSDRGLWLGRADLVYREWKVIVEYDGDQHRTNNVQYEKDIARIERFERAGWIVVRVRARGIAAGRAETLARVARALTSRGWSAR